MELISPSVEYKKSFIEAVKEYKTEGETAPTKRYRDLSLEELESDFESFLAKEKSHQEGKNLPDNYVPQTEYWLVEGEKYFGHASVRHRLNEHLLQIGGHIGYEIRPSERGKGYGNTILKLALEKAKEMGVENVRITCDASNSASRKVIEKNGGVFDSAIPNPETGINKNRYWISLQQ